MSLFLDTYAIIELFEGSEKGKKIKELIEREKEVLVSALSLYETGAILDREVGPARSEEYVRSIKTYYRIVDVDQEVALLAIELKRKFKLPAMDCLIYASVKLQGSKIVSGCKHFKGLGEQADVLII